MWTPRAIVAFGAAVVAAAALWAAFDRARPDFDFVPHDAVEGFRRLESGAVSVADPLAGLGGGPAAAPVGDLCAALFGGPPPAGVAPVAYFTDYRCPYCRVMSERVAEIAERDDVAVAWREWPIFGPVSRMAARAALAARRQGAYRDFHSRLMRSAFVPTPAYLDAAAAEMGLDAARLKADAESDAVAREIARSEALARRFGFVGTPALVVGRTVVEGEIPARDLGALIELERDAGPPPVCRA